MYRFWISGTKTKSKVSFYGELVYIIRPLVKLCAQKSKNGTTTRPEIQKRYIKAPKSGKSYVPRAQKSKNGTARTEKLIIKEPTKSIFTNAPKI